MPIQHNSYFDAAVQSVASERHGRKFSVGIISTGTYHFGTDAAERMTVISGLLKVKLDGTTDWISFPAGTNFEVPANSGFDVAADQDSAYQCEYL
jgi:purine/pyrimidine-nucleoside phosphorylase